MSHHQANARKIMLIRHAEKPPASPPPHGVNANGHHDPESLLVRGWQRAGALATLFAPANGVFQHPGLATPRHVYASTIGKGSASERPQETVTPLVDKLGQAVKTDFSYAKGDEAEVAAAAQQHHHTVLICWEHQGIPLIAKHLPLSRHNTQPAPSAWPGKRYDVVWIFDLDNSGDGYLFSQAPQLLLAGDAPL